MTAKDIKDFKENVIEQIADEYAVSADAARKAVNESFLVKALSIDPEETIHSSIDDWARYVYENHIKE